MGVNGRVHVLNHPFLQQELTRVRDKNLSQIEFRRSLVRIGRYMGYEILKSFKKREVLVETPLAKTKGVKIEGIDKVLIITVLRAAIPLTEGLIRIFPLSRQGIISARRMEESYRGGEKFDIEINYVKIPSIHEDTVVIISDPMLATGSTLEAVIEKIIKIKKPKRLIVACVVSAETGVKRILDRFPFVEIYTLAIDPELNSKGYIVPGLGDAGDRAFGE